VAYFILCVAMASMVTHWSRHRFAIALFGWGIVGAHVVSGIFQAMRAVVLLPMTLLVAINWQRARDGLRTYWRVVAMVFVATLLVAPLVAAAVGLIRMLGTGRLDLQAVQQGYDAVVTNLTVAERARLGAQEVNTKFDAFTYGTMLLDLEGVGSAGWKPYTSSLLSPVPRILLPNKPVPISRDGHNSGMPYRVAAQNLGSVEQGMVVPVSPVAIVLWELGHPGLALLIILNLLSFAMANSLLSAASIFARAVGVAMLSLPTAEFLYAPPASLVRDIPRYLLYLFVLWFVTQAIAVVRRYSGTSLSPVGGTTP
jgi:hypothetical protein